MKTPAYLTFTPTVINDDAGLPKRFTGIAYSGGVIPGYGGYGDAAIDLSTLALPDGPIFALVDHDHSRRAGKLTAELRDNQIHVSGEFFASSEAGREVAALFQEGAPWQMSVGIQALSQTTDKKRAVTCNGNTLQLNSLFTGAILREVSFVPVGADPATSAVAFAHRTAAPATGEPSKGNNMTLEELQTKVAALESTLATETARADTATSALAEINASTRAASIKTLAADLARELSDEETAIFKQLDDAAFTVLSASMRSFKPTAPGHLFSAQVTAEHQAHAKAEDSTVQEMHATLLKQVTGKKD